MSHYRLSWPYAWGGPAASARFKTEPADFQVEEILPDSFSGDGEHLCLWLEKEGDNTDWVARQLARCLGVDPMAVGFCGLKDRQAVTRQWFSVQLPGISNGQALDQLGTGFRVLDSRRHRSKLRRGDHWGNRFLVRLRDVEGDRAQVESRLARLAEKGSPNYFGKQRFGHDGGNLDAAARLNPRKLRGRNVRTGLYLSAARSWLFNELLARRVEEGSWLSLLPGDPSSRGATGPLFGDGGGGAREPLSGPEDGFLAQYPEFDRLFRARRLRPERRELALQARDFTFRWDGNDLILGFSLPAGGYATTWLGEAVQLEVTTAREQPDRDEQAE